MDELADQAGSAMEAEQDLGDLGDPLSGGDGQGLDDLFSDPLSGGGGLDDPFGDPLGGGGDLGTDGPADPAAGGSEHGGPTSLANEVAHAAGGGQHHEAAGGQHHESGGGSHHEAAGGQHHEAGGSQHESGGGQHHGSGDTSIEGVHPGGLLDDGGLDIPGLDGGDPFSDPSMDPFDMGGGDFPGMPGDFDPGMGDTSDPAAGGMDDGGYGGGDDGSFDPLPDPSGMDMQ